jgi:hypothetical protein
MLHSASSGYSTGGFWATLHECLGVILRICTRMMTVTLCLGVLFCTLVLGVLKVVESPQAWRNNHPFVVFLLAPDLVQSFDQADYSSDGPHSIAAAVRDPNWDGMLVGGVWGTTLGQGIPLIGGVAGPVVGAALGYLVDKRF